MGWMDELKTAAGLQAALVQHGPRLAAGLMAALIAIQAGFFVTSQNSGLASPVAAHGPVGGPVGPARPTNANLSTLHVSEITSAHLFGETHSTVDDANAPQTSVQLVLAGVLAVPDPKRGLAIIGPNAGTAKLYTVGSAVPGGVNLYSVYADRVLLDRGGVIESLLLPRKAPLAGTLPPAANSLSPGQRLATLAQGNNAAVLGGLVRAQPVFVGTKLTGYRIYPGGRTSVGAFTHLGLRPGDLITGVNGTPLDDPARANEILQTLSSLASANLTIQRNGQSQELTLNLETVASDAENVAAAAMRHEAQQGGPSPAPPRFPGAAGNAAPPVVADPDDTEPPPVEDPAENAPSDDQ
jgi:general secretion pathway protein C